MTKARESKKLILDSITLADAEIILAEYAEADAKINKINSDMDIQFTKIREKNTDKLAELTEKKALAMEKLQVFASAKKELFADKKSLEMTHGKIGFRTGMPSLAKLKGFTWDSVANMLETFLPDHLRVKKEANKEKLLADRDLPEVSELFTKCGVKVEQSEAFFVELKKEETAA